MLSGSRASTIDSPGPGYYSPIYETISKNVSPRKKASTSPKKSPSKTNSIHDSYMHGDLMVRITGRSHDNLGPGQYNIPLSTFEIKSFNQRVNKNLIK